MELRENGKRDALDILFAALAATLATLLLVLVFAGLIAGVLYYLVTLLVLSAADGFKNAYFSAVDLICSAAGGAVAGVLAVNLKGRRRRG